MKNITNERRKKQIVRTHFTDRKRSKTYIVTENVGQQKADTHITHRASTIAAAATTKERMNKQKKSLQSE